MHALRITDRFHKIYQWQFKTNDQATFYPGYS